jgi:hypothetical protein
MREPTWLPLDLIIRLRGRQIEVHGGLPLHYQRNRQLCARLPHQRIAQRVKHRKYNDAFRLDAEQH